MQTAAKLVVMLVIVPAAILIAVYFITEPLIPVVITRQFFSVSIAMSLAGLLVVRTRRPRLGALLVLIGSAVGAATLASFWNSFFATMACVHVLLIIGLFTAQSLSHRAIIAEPKAVVLRYFISAAILATGPLTGTAYAVSLSLTPDAVAATTMLLLVLYTSVLQYYLKEPRLGLFNSAILSLVFGTALAPVLFGFALNPNIILIGSSFVFFLGIGLVLTSQSLRIIRNLVAKRPAERKKRDILLESLLEPMANKPKDAEPELPETVYAGEWIISPYHAHMASALGVFLTALGIPANFLLRAKVTGWGAEESFDLLFIPLAVLVTLLVLVPSPVFLRLGQSIKRSTETFLVHLLGIGVVLAAALSTFEWTQFSLWSLQSSLAASVFLVLVGLTGLFREIRRLWRRAWMSIMNSFRAVRRWITSHPIQTGIVVDSFLTLLLVSLLYPTFSQQTRSHIGLLTLSVAVFSLIALLGVAGLKRFRRRMLLAAVAWSILLCAAAGFSFWYMVDAMSILVPDAASVASLWMLGMAVLLRLGIPRRVSAGPYALGLVGMMCQFWRLDFLALGILYVIPPIVVALVLGAPFLHKEYKTALSRLHSVLARAWKPFARAVRAAAAAAYYVLSSLGDIIYRGIVFVGVLLVKFVLLAYAIFVTTGILYLGYSVFLPAYEFDSVMAAALSVTLFFLLYAPAVGYKGRGRPHVVSGFIVGLAVSLTVFLFLNLVRTYAATPEMSLLASATVGMGIAAALRSALPERTRSVLPIALYLLLVSDVSAVVFRLALVVQPELVAGAAAGIPFAAGLLALGLEGRYRRFARTGYAIIIAPSALIVCYAAFTDVVLLPFMLLLTLAPVAYPLYVRAARVLAAVTVKALKALFALVLAHLVIAFGMISVVGAVAAFQVSYTFFDAYLYSDLARTIFFPLLFIVIWIPSVFFRRTSYGQLLSGLLILLSLLTAILIMTWVQPLEPIQTLFIGLTVCAFMLAVFSRLIKEIPSWRIPLAVMLFSLLLLGLHVVALEITLELLFASFGTVTIVMLVAGRRIALQLTYPVATATGLGLLFNVVVLPITEPLFAMAMYVGVEALLLCAVKEIYRWPLWVIFCICAGYVAYGVLFPLTQASIFLACLLVLELLRITPGENGRPQLLHDVVAVARALLVGLVAGFFAGGYTTLVLTLALSALSGLLTLRFHFTGRPAARGTILVEDAIMAVSTMIIGESVAMVLGGYTLASFFAAAIPTTVFLAIRVQRGIYAFAHYLALSAIAIITASSFWLLVGYSPLDSFPLTLSSGFTAAVTLYFGRPSSLSTGPRTMLIPITALIASLEVIWIWHAFLVFHLPGTIALVGAGFVFFSTFLYPASSNLDWLKFEYVWDMASVVNAISLGAVASAWDLWAGPIPPYPLLTFGWCLSLYSLFSAPLSVVGQRRLGLEGTAHMNWAPSLVAWPLLMWNYASPSSTQPQFLLGLMVLAFCGAAGVFVLLHPHRTAAMVRWLDIGVATTGAYLVWTSGMIPDGLLGYRAASCAIVWYLLTLPFTLPLTILVGKRVIKFVVDHKGTFALILPGLVGLLVFFFVSQYEAGLILGLESRQLIAGIGVGMLVSGIGWVQAKSVVDSAKRLGGVFIFLGFLTSSVSGIMPYTLVPIPEIVFLLSACLTASLILLSVLGSHLHLETTRHLAHATGGFTAGIATFVGLTYYWTAYVLDAVLVAIFVTFIIETPFLKEQILALIHLLSNLGALIAAALCRLGAMLKAIFLRFGYVMWTLFSVLVVLGVGYLSFPFFSEWVGMRPGRPLYVIPSYSMPLMLLGLLLITVTAARRRVKTRFGWTGVLTALAGGGFTGVAWLLDKDLALLAASVTLAMISVIVTALNRARRADIARIAAGWTPTPIACGIALYSAMNPPVSNLSLQVVAAGLSVLVMSVLLVASEKIGLIPKTTTRYFVVIIAFTSGVITYASTDLASMDLLARLYLSVFVVSWLLLPVARREWIYLFYAPLFFSLTGFAFTFVFGQLSQSLLLAMAAFLLFITLLVRDRERVRPKLVFLRLALLLLLVGCIAAFAVISFFSVL